MNNRKTVMDFITKWTNKKGQEDADDKVFWNDYYYEFQYTLFKNKNAYY